MNWGGKRRGAGRKPKGEMAGVSHAPRPKLAARHPVHVTVKLVKGLPSLRRKPVHALLRDCLAAGYARFGLHVVHYSLQSNHAHLMVEADDERSLSRGMQGLCVRLARALNRLWRRTGRLFLERFHARILATPREVRNALRYVLLNSAHHGERFRDGLDPFSSAERFDGWKRAPATHICAESSSASDPPRRFLGRARTWLLSKGWRIHGLLPRP